MHADPPPKVACANGNQKTNGTVKYSIKAVSDHGQAVLTNLEVS